MGSTILTPNWVVVFLGIYWIWIFLAQRFLAQILVYEMLFVAMTAANLWQSGQWRQIKAYTIGRWLPVRSPLLVTALFFAVVTVSHFFFTGIQSSPVKTPTLSLLVFAPVMEEMVFRGILLTILLGHATAPRWAMILLGSLLFAGCHVIEEPWSIVDPIV